MYISITSRRCAQKVFNHKVCNLFSRRYKSLAYFTHCYIIKNPGDHCLIWFKIRQKPLSTSRIAEVYLFVSSHSSVFHSCLISLPLSTSERLFQLLRIKSNLLLRFHVHKYGKHRDSTWMGSIENGKLARRCKGNNNNNNNSFVSMTMVKVHWMQRKSRETVSYYICVLLYISGPLWSTFFTKL